MPDPINPIAALDSLSHATVHLTMYFKVPDSAISDRQCLGTATGFIREVRGQSFLITARHNLTGRHPKTKKLISDTGGIPNEIDLNGFNLQASLQLYGRRIPPDHCDSLQPRYCLHPKVYDSC